MLAYLLTCLLTYPDLRDLDVGQDGWGAAMAVCRSAALHATLAPSTRLMILTIGGRGAWMGSTAAWSARQACRVQLKIAPSATTSSPTASAGPMPRAVLLSARSPMATEIKENYVVVCVGCLSTRRYVLGVCNPCSRPLRTSKPRECIRGGTL